MTNFPPPDPQSSRDPLGFDDFMGVLVAFGTIGAILLFSLLPRDRGLNLIGLLSPSPSPTVQPTLSPTPNAEATTTPIVPIVPSVVPTQSPDLLIVPSPTRTPLTQSPTVIPAPIPVPRATVSPSPTPTPTSTPTQPINFVDVPENYWARPFIDALSARGIVSGFVGDYFRPDRPVTRAEFAAILQDAFDQSPGENTTLFNDVPSNFWAVRAIERATNTGFLRGYPGEIFRPQQQIPRVQALVALASGLNLQPPADVNTVLGTYTDAADIPNYAREKVAAATASGLVVNYPNRNELRPNRDATRAEVAAIVHQALVQAGKAEPIESQYFVRQQ